MLDQTGQDPVEVEPAADVGRHSAEGVRAVEAMGDLVRSAGRPDDRPDRGRDLGQERRVERRPIAVRIGHDHEAAPRPTVDRDRDRDLRCSAERGAGHRAAVVGVRPIDRLTERAGRARLVR